MTDKDWMIQYDKQEVGKRSYGQESLMSLGNGYLGLRGRLCGQLVRIIIIRDSMSQGSLITQVQKLQVMMLSTKIWSIGQIHN